MTFEEQLTRAFETLTDRLRGDIDLQVQRTVAELVAAAPHDRDRDVSDVQSTTEEMDIVVAAARQEAREEGLAAGREVGRREALDERGPQTVDIASRARLADAVRSLERARSLTEILDTLVSGACAEAAGADVWLIRGGRLHRWRSPGSAGADADQVPARSLDEGGLIADAARTGAVASAEGTLAVPIAIAGQVIAVLFADLGEPGTQNLEPETGNLERTLNREARTSNLELLTRYAARCLEALTAFKAARALTQKPDEPDAADGLPPARSVSERGEHAPSRPTPPANNSWNSEVVPRAARLPGDREALLERAPGDEASAEEDTAARRYARLLVSEIKLYHESAVVDGRRDRDLAARLGGEIARARAMFEERVAPHVRQRGDYFHDELVRTLANGDASLLEVRS